MQNTTKSQAALISSVDKLKLSICWLKTELQRKNLKIKIIITNKQLKLVRNY